MCKSEICRSILKFAVQRERRARTYWERGDVEAERRVQRKEQVAEDASEAPIARVECLVASNVFACLGNLVEVDSVERLL